MTEKIASGSDRYRPDQRSRGIEQNELFNGYGAHSNDKRSNCAQSVKKPKEKIRRINSQTYYASRSRRYKTTIKTRLPANIQTGPNSHRASGTDR